MSLSRSRSIQLCLVGAGVVSAILMGGALRLSAQYPGHITTKKTQQIDRAVAVLEWTGSPGKPSASRIIPLSVYDGEQYQPGGLYLAHPEPLAVESGTEYVLEHAGLPQGLYEVNGAQSVQGYWFGYGNWKPLNNVPTISKLHPSKIKPQLVGDDGRPHLKNSSPDQNTSQTASSPAPKSSPPQDPDRPTLRRRSAQDEPAKDITAPDSTPRETAISGPDPDRPYLTHAPQNPTDNSFESTKLTGAPPGLQQMIAVSDAANRDPHPFAYNWSSPDDAKKMQAQMEVLAQKAIAATEPSAKPKPAPAVHTAAVSAARHRRPAAKPAAPLPELSQERMDAYELTFSGGATLIFSAQSTGADGKTKYVTLIAQPDLYGVPVVLLHSVTDDAHLEETPRMRLVDAVDTAAADRGDLIFELRGSRDRQFVIYTIDRGQANQIFSTGSLPLSNE